MSMYTMFYSQGRGYNDHETCSKSSFEEGYYKIKIQCLTIRPLLHTL